MKINRSYNAEGDSFPNCKIKFYELDKTNSFSSKLPDIDKSGFNPMFDVIGYRWTNHESRYLHKLDWIRYLNLQLYGNTVIPEPPIGYGYPNYETIPGSDLYEKLDRLILSVGPGDTTADLLTCLKYRTPGILNNDCVVWQPIYEIYGMYWARCVYPISDLKRVEAEYERTILEWSDSDIEFAKGGYDIYGVGDIMTSVIDQYKSLPPVDPNFYGTFSDNVTEGVIPYQATIKAGGTNQSYTQGNFSDTESPEINVSPDIPSEEEHTKSIIEELEECHRKISEQNQYIQELERDAELYQSSTISIRSKARVLIKCYKDRIALDQQIKALEDDLTSD